MNTNASLNRAIKAKNDEFYTPMETVIRVFQVYLKTYDFKGKIIYCPCDTEKSNFVIYLKEHKNDLQYKDLIYTWDDFNTHNNLFNMADIIITNPPFSKLFKEFLPLLNYYQKDYFIFGAFCSIEGYYRHMPNVLFYYYENEYENYYITDKGEKKRVATIYMTNMNLDSNYSKRKKFIPTSTELSTLYDSKYHLRAYDRIADIPKKECMTDQKEKFLVPITILLQHNRYLFNIIGSYLYKDYSDSKRRFPKIIVQYK